MRKSTILELSDGWYRIQAQIDATLASACQRGRLQVGQKLAIMGATLDAQGDGNEVLAAYHMSTLVLASNSVSLAPWDARLGFSRTPFCASLRSLTSDGGLVSLMDIVITKVYPLAYVTSMTALPPPATQQLRVANRRKPKNASFGQEDVKMPLRNSRCKSKRSPVDFTISWKR